MPSGTVTFLFTDIEGSTRKWQNWPHQMKKALKCHDDILQRIILEHDGYVFKTVGDAFCASFNRAIDCVYCAVAIQLAINVENWDLPESFRVRMSIHTGEAIERNGDYYGPALNRVARLEAIAWGGQIVMSFVSTELVRDMLNEPIGIASLGSHRLKDLIRPEEVFQIIHPDLQKEFEPVKSLDMHQHNLEIQPSLLIGRDEELKQIINNVVRTDSRILTITGPGGMGKTRIAIQAGGEMIEHFCHGVFFIDLTLIKELEDFYPLILSTLKITESANNSIFDEIVNNLSDKKILLILDNFEHLMDASVLAANLLKKCPRLKYLVTSREALHLRGEKVYHLPPLSIPETEGDLSLKKMNQFNSVKLFIERAVEVKDDFQVTNQNAPYIAQICSVLDGIPLAIELAAARISTLTPKAIQKRLNHSLDILTFGAPDLPERHRTLRSTIRWSYELLDRNSQELFLSLSVFRGLFDIAAAEAVCSMSSINVLDGLEHLVEKNLIVRKDLPDDEPRFYMLETIHEFALDLCMKDQELFQYAESIFETYIIKFCLESEHGISGKDQKIWVDKIVSFYGSIIYVLRKFIRIEDFVTLSEIVNSFWPYWETVGAYREGMEFCSLAFNKTGEVNSGIGYSALMIGLGEYERALDVLNQIESDNLLKQYYLGWAHFRLNHIETANNVFLDLELKSELSKSKKLEAKALFGLSVVNWKKGKNDIALEQLSKSLVFLKYCGDPRSIAQTINNLGIIYYQTGDYLKAEKYFKESLPIFKDLSQMGEIWKVLNNLGYISYHLGKYKLSIRYYRELNSLVSDDFWHATAFLGMAESEIKLNKYNIAREKCQKAMDLFADKYPGDYGIALRVLGDLFQAEGKSSEAISSYELAIPLLRDNEETDELKLAEKALGDIS